MVFGRNASTRGNAPSVSQIARGMIARANAARDGQHYRDAALLYAEALRLVPDNAAIQVQAGHMFKESGDLAAAEAHYLHAAALTPNDADLALQLGHFYKSAGRLDEADAAYRRASTLTPGWEAPLLERESLATAGWRSAAIDPQDAMLLDALDDIAIRDLPETLRRDRADGLVPTLAPADPADLLHAYSERIELRQLGRRERSHWGILRTLRGIEALRGVCLSATPLLELQLTINGQLIHRGALKGGYALKYEAHDRALRKYVFNVWYDFSDFVPGRYELEFRIVDMRRQTRSHHEWIVIAPPLSEDDHPECDGLVTVARGAGGMLDDRINARASMIRPGQRALLSTPPRSVLVQRADQLGDLVASIPALRRLREILPAARIVGLLTGANAELAATLDLFDEIIVIDFPDDKVQRRRIMPLPAQEVLRARLAGYAFDMAIDLSENSSSRPLLLLSGAPFLYGFRSGDVPSLNVEIEANTHNRLNGHEVVPHTNKLMGFVEWLGAMLKSHVEIVRRDDLEWDRLAAYGILKGDRFAVLHDGARLPFSRWPHYRALAQMLVAQNDLKVVLLTDDPLLRDALPPELAGSERFVLVDGRLSFDDFDALLSYCTVFVGNDSGPKHLAALRGAKVVSVHMARNNWNEWGQESGYVVSRKVPCAGCLIWHDPEECGKDFACLTGIKPEEVLRAVMKLV